MFPMIGFIAVGNSVMSIFSSTTEALMHQIGLFYGGYVAGWLAGLVTFCQHDFSGSTKGTNL